MEEFYTLGEKLRDTTELYRYLQQRTSIIGQGVPDLIPTTVEITEDDLVFINDIPGLIDSLYEESSKIINEFKEFIAIEGGSLTERTLQDLLTNKVSSGTINIKKFSSREETERSSDPEKSMQDRLSLRKKVKELLIKHLDVQQVAYAAYTLSENDARIENFETNEEFGEFFLGEIEDFVNRIFEIYAGNKDSRENREILKSLVNEKLGRNFKLTELEKVFGIFINYIKTVIAYTDPTTKPIVSDIFINIINRFSSNLSNDLYIINKTGGFIPES